MASKNGTFRIRRSKRLHPFLGGIPSCDCINSIYKTCNIRVLGKDPPCLQFATAVGTSSLVFVYKRKRLLVIIAPVDAIVKKVIPVSLLVHLLFTYQYRVLGGHPTERGMYHNMQRENTGHTIHNMYIEQWPNATNAHTTERRRQKRSTWYSSWLTFYWSLPPRKYFAKCHKYR